MILEETKRDKIRIRAERRKNKKCNGDEYCKGMLEGEVERGNQNKKHSRETGIPNEKWIQPSWYRSANRKECKRGKNTKRKRRGSAKQTQYSKIR